MKKPNPNRAAALRGLRRLASGKVNDAAILAFRGGELSDEEIAKLDLSAVTGISAPKKDGGCDVKLADPMDALKLLLEQCGPAESEAADSLIEALNRAAETDAI